MQMTYRADAMWFGLDPDTSVVKGETSRNHPIGRHILPVD